MAELLEVKNLSVSFDTPRGELQAVRDVSFTLHEGEVLAVVGESGSGKSVLCKAIMKLLRKDARIKGGSILVDGVDITNYRPRDMERLRGKLFSMVFQDPMTGTAADMQIVENLALAARRGSRRSFLRWGVPKAEYETYRELLKTLDLGLEDRMTTKVGLLSGGQRQALTLLMATLKKPKLLLLDEHTAALDPKSSERVMELTRRVVSEKQLTTLMVTHNLKFAVNYGNRLLMMHQGHSVIDIQDEEKAACTVEDLLSTFNSISIECGN